MVKNAAITIRLPLPLKRRLEARAKAQRRSLSAQVVADLESINELPSNGDVLEGRFLGMFEGTRVPTEDDIEEVRGLLWGNLGR